MKAEARVCFYNSTRIQGWRKWVIGLLQGTNHTHVHIELRFTAYRLVLLTLDGSSPRIIRLGLNKKFLGAVPYSEITFGLLNLTENFEVYVTQYPMTSRWDLLRYQVLSYFGKQDKNNIPPTCATFVSDFLQIHHKQVPRFFSPKQLWRYFYDGNNVGR